MWLCPKCLLAKLRNKLKNRVCSLANVHSNTRLKKYLTRLLLTAVSQSEERPTVSPQLAWWSYGFQRQYLCSELPRNRAFLDQLRFFFWGGVRQTAASTPNMCMYVEPRQAYNNKASYRCWVRGGKLTVATSTAQRSEHLIQMVFFHVLNTSQRLQTYIMHCSIL